MKYLIVGSAPYVEEYYNKRRRKYADYFICGVNNSWRVVYDNISEWFIPDDFLKPNPSKGIHGGTLLPNEIERKNIQITPMPPGRIEGYHHKKGSTMMINVMHILFNRYLNTRHKLEVVVMGSDFVYEKDRTHFYGVPKPNQVVRTLIDYNNPKYGGIAADPMRFGDDWLEVELMNVWERYKHRGFEIYRDTPLENSKLPFEDV